MSELQRKTIADFGEQWTEYPDTDGFFGSSTLFDDFCHPFVAAGDTAGKRVAEIGAGIGRFINVLARAGAQHLIALEPSDAFRVLHQNTQAFRDRITYLNATGDHLPASGDLDYVFVIGVLHHIPDPDPVVAAAYRALAPGGTLLVWVYGREGNAGSLLLMRLLWQVTRRLPHRALERLVAAAYPAFWCYMTACRWLPLPLADYLRRVILPLTPAKRRVVIYDQLNPAYAKYYTGDEAQAVLTRNGFTDIRLHHRYGRSWTVAGVKPR
jgi:SAM-dependent methyltransferase